MNDRVQSTVTQKLVYLKQKQFTGKVIIQQASQPNWYIYLCCGRLVWTDGGIHPNRSWNRLVSKYCAQIDFKKLKLKNIDWFEAIDYCVLNLLVQNKLIEREGAAELITAKATEALFDILQAETNQSLKITLEVATASSVLTSGASKFIFLVNLDDVIENARQAWLIWQHNKLQAWSPNLAPVIKEPDKLRQEVSETIYQNFLKLLNSQKTLRDLNIQIDKDIGKLTISLMPYIRRGLLDLVEIEDIAPPKYAVKTSDLKASPHSDTPLIVCIDDSPQICKIMEQIIVGYGYRFVGIQESLQALPVLIGVNPSIIFLDIGMPIVNGYELCAQLRRVSKLKEIPIIFLTGNDGIVDRMRAKVVGGTDFLGKPVEIDKIYKAIQKYSEFRLTNKQVN